MIRLKQWIETTALTNYHLYHSYSKKKKKIIHMMNFLYVIYFNVDRYKTIKADEVIIRREKN